MAIVDEIEIADDAYPPRARRPQGKIDTGDHIDATRMCSQHIVGLAMRPRIEQILVLAGHLWPKRIGIAATALLARTIEDLLHALQRGPLPSHACRGLRRRRRILREIGPVLLAVQLWISLAKSIFITALMIHIVVVTVIIYIITSKNLADKAPRALAQQRQREEQAKP